MGIYTLIADWYKTHRDRRYWYQHQDFAVKSSLTGPYRRACEKSDKQYVAIVAYYLGKGTT